MPHIPQNKLIQQEMNNNKHGFAKNNRVKQA